MAPDGALEAEKKMNSIDCVAGPAGQFFRPAPIALYLSLNSVPREEARW